MKSLKENLLRSIARRGVLVLVAGIGLAAMAWLHVNAPDSMKTWLATAWGVLATGVVIFHLDRWLARRDATEAPTNLPDEDHAHYRQIEAWANKLFQAIDQNPTTVFITDAEGRFEYVNDFFLTSTGYTRDEVLGQSMEILSPQEADAPTSQEMRNCAQRGACWQGEVQTRRRDGSVFWERVMFSPLKDRHGKLTNFVAIKENITEWRQVMTRLQESEHRFRTATSAMVEGLALIGPDGRFLFTNRAVEDFLGNPPGGLLGLRPEDIGIDRLHADGSPCAPADYPVVYSLREGRELRHLVFGLRYTDGSVRWMEINSTLLPIGTNGEQGLVATLSDISERRQAEAR